MTLAVRLGDVEVDVLVVVGAEVQEGTWAVILVPAKDAMVHVRGDPLAPEVLTTTLRAPLYGHTSLCKRVRLPGRLTLHPRPFQRYAASQGLGAFHKIRSVISSPHPEQVKRNRPG